MRRLAVYPIIALFTFCFSAFIAIQCYHRYLDVKPDQTEFVSQPTASIDNSAASSASPIEETDDPEIPVPIKRELDARFPGWRFPKIDPEIGKYLREYDPANSHPAFISGDFDGNGQQDYAVFIEHGVSAENANDIPVSVNSELVVFLTRRNKFKLHLLYPAEYIAFIKKGESGYDYETDKRFTYENDSIFTGFWEKAGSSYVYKKGKFREVITSD